jgi:hypothetical protein
VIFARAVTRPDEDIELTTLGAADLPAPTCGQFLIVGSSNETHLAWEW